MTDRAKTLEQEARELYKVIVSAMKPETPRYTEIGEQIAEFQFVQGYIAAATARDKEIEELRAELADWHESAKMAAGESCGDEQHCTCVGALRARVKELEGLVPRWARNMERYQLEKLGWLVAGGEMVWHRSPGDIEASWHCLMVPPIPLPEPKS